jgi:hypothetical protein
MRTDCVSGDSSVGLGSLTGTSKLPAAAVMKFCIISAGHRGAKFKPLAWCTALLMMLTHPAA